MRKRFDLVLGLVLLSLVACQNQPESEPTTPPPTPIDSSSTTTLSRPQQAAEIPVGTVLPQTVSAPRIERRAEGEDELYFYRTTEKELAIGAEDDEGLSPLEAHIAQIISIGSFRCAQKSPKSLRFVVVNGAGQLHGTFEFSCAYTRRVVRNIGLGENTEYEIRAGGNPERLTTAQLQIHSNNLGTFRQMVRGIPFADYGEVKVGSAIQ
ncbi:MAG: hypothetical protein AAFW73_13290 [Bacteroidota bacterium]